MFDSSERIAELIRQLQSIAVANQDRFSYKLEIEPTRKGLRYSFSATEDADGHCFVMGYGATIEEAIEDALANIKEACEEWGYKAGSA